MGLRLLIAIAAFPATGFDGACPPSSPYILNGLSSFSNFRLGGVSPSGGTLPVELVYLEAYGVENKFIQLAWQTATEINNDGLKVLYCLMQKLVQN